MKLRTRLVQELLGRSAFLADHSRIRAVLLPVTESGGGDDPYPTLYNGDSIEIAEDGSWVVERASLGEDAPDRLIRDEMGVGAGWYGDQTVIACQNPAALGEDTT